MFMSQKSSSCSSNCIAWGIFAGAAIGCATALISKKKKNAMPCMKKRAISALETAGTVMHNMADLVK